MNFQVCESIFFSNDIHHPGCGTGEGAMLAMNSFPGVICGHVEEPADAYTFIKGAAAGEHFQELFFPNCKNTAIQEYVKSLL